jgi:tripartite-type tricarboxylate transporter receptor subunit TctC
MSRAFCQSRRRCLLAGTAGGFAAWAQAQPSAGAAPGIRLVVPFAPGGVLDALARPLAEHAQERLGPIFVDNIAGQRGSRGSTYVAQAAPDGTTLLLGSVITQSINPSVAGGQLYDPIRDFTPVALLARLSNVLVVNAETAHRLSINNVADLVHHARAHPGRLTYASVGMGTTSHLAAELFKERTGSQLNHQPYAGVNAAVKALLGGEVDLSFQNISNTYAEIRAGRLKALAVSTLWRSADLPEVPTLNEITAIPGLAGFDVGIWFGLFGPAHLSRELTLKFNAAFVDALNAPEVREKLKALKIDAAPSTPEQLAALVKADLQRYKPLVQRSRAVLP